jgi:hypothetical protein
MKLSLAQISRPGKSSIHDSVSLVQELTYSRLMALLELCEIDYFSCGRLVLCIDRHADQAARNNLTKDLGWIGFGLTTLDEFSQGEKLTSDKWLFMDMEV